jgi:hypothetical protein
MEKRDPDIVRLGKATVFWKISFLAVSPVPEVRRGRIH